MKFAILLSIGLLTAQKIKKTKKEKKRDKAIKKNTFGIPRGLIKQKDKKGKLGWLIISDLEQGLKLLIISSEV